MFELCPCLDSLYAGVPDEIALRSLADLGFRHFEFWDWRTHDLEVLAKAPGAGGDPREKRGEAAVAALRRGGALAAEAGVQLLVEPLNSAVDHPGYFLDSLSQARRLLEEAHHPSIRLLLDVYHLWGMHPDLLADLPAVVAITGHVHLADAPGRHEPGTGTIPWPAAVER